MAIDVDTVFDRQIGRLENRFFDSLIDHDSLSSFDKEWSAFSIDFQVRIGAQTLGAASLSKSHSLAESISNVIEAFTELDVLSENLISALVLETSTILTDGSTRRLDTGGAPPTTSLQASSRTNGLPPYIKLSYRWLLDNLHNPYPSIGIREEIARESGCDRKDVDNWFVDARKRIGWNALRKSHFDNKRSDILDAAFRHFVREDPKRPIKHSIHYKFNKILRYATDLYQGKFTETTLATKLDEAVKDLTPEMEVEAKADLKRKRKEERVKRKGPPSCYPSSPRCSTDFGSNLDDAVCLDIQSPTQNIQDCQRQIKRPRISDASSSADASLSFPASSTVEQSPTNVQNAVSRRRRMSDADVTKTSKRPCNAQIRPRQHAVSDPLPSIAREAPYEWVLGDHIPSGVVVEEYSDLSHFGVEMWDPSIFFCEDDKEPLPIGHEILSKEDGQQGYPANYTSPQTVQSLSSAPEAEITSLLSDPIFQDFFERSSASATQPFILDVNDISSSTILDLGLSVPDVQTRSECDTALIVDLSTPVSMHPNWGSDLSWPQIPFLDAQSQCFALQDKLPTDFYSSPIVRSNSVSLW